MMTQIAYALLAFNLSILLTVQAVDSQHVPKTCQCPQVKSRVHGPFSDLKVTPKGPNCLQNEIIVVRQKNNNPVCLNPEGRQGKRLLKCWQRMQRGGKDSKNCIRRQNPGPRQRKRMQSRKSKKATS
ncbi:C-X-C motif chemokine 9 [Pimephales promelas]|uniref:C-X-C motif chemokine 9 n=1 Tax=Pimephales promelas TaxID=90988 RepID=UPI001955CDD5|nr:C-X-C motif chemokine 9 [Pimephales promelas]